MARHMVNRAIPGLGQMILAGGSGAWLGFLAIPAIATPVPATPQQVTPLPATSVHHPVLVNHFMQSGGWAIAQASSNPDTRGYMPPDRGLPGRREGGGTRGSTIIEGQPLTALIPDTNLGLTLADYPSFFFYIPPTDGLTAEFILFDANYTEIYRTLVTLPSESGILNIPLPTDGSILPLAVDQDYHWFFSIVTDPQDRSSDIYVEGWVQRVAADETLTQALAQATPAERPTLYAASGIWFDSLMDLAALRQENPENAAAIAQWEAFLTDVGLEAIAAEPLLTPPSEVAPLLNTLPDPQQPGAHNLPDIRTLDRPVPAIPMPTSAPSPQPTDEETHPDASESNLSGAVIPPDIGGDAGGEPPLGTRSVAAKAAQQRE